MNVTVRAAPWVATAAIVSAACAKPDAPSSVPVTALAQGTATASATATTTASASASATGSASATPIATAPASATASAAAPLPTAPLDMLLVPDGSFTMGADAGGQEDERPAHVVTLSAFWLDKQEVTNAKWDECVRAGVCTEKAARVRIGHPDFNGPEQPVSGISWNEARAYCAWRGKRLPREAEFERAVRDGDNRRYPWGNDPPTHDKTVFGGPRPEDVGTHPAGRGPYGHDDLAGNVWEWMQDEYDPYAYRRPGAASGTPGTCSEIMETLSELRRTGKQGFTGANPIPTVCEHSIRGGAYNYDADGLRASNRVHHPGGYRIPMLGLRCAKDAP